MKEQVLNNTKDIDTITYKTRQRTYLLGGNLFYGCKMYIEDISKPNSIYIVGETKMGLRNKVISRCRHYIRCNCFCASYILYVFIKFNMQE